MALIGTIEELKTKYRDWYLKIVEVECPILQEKVIFNMQGFQHLFFHSNGKKRLPDDIKLRLGIVKHAPMVIRKSRKLVDARVITSSFGKDISFYELVHYISEKRIPITVILRRIGKGNLHYFSVRYGKQKKTR